MRSMSVCDWQTGSIFLSKDLKFLAVQMSRWNIGFLDVKEISSNALAELYTDILAGEKSIIRGVFGIPLLPFSFSFSSALCI